MIKFEHTEVVGWEAAIRGMRNPLESWEKSDSVFEEDNAFYDEEKDIWCNDFPLLGTDDEKLMMRLRNAGTDHRKYLRMIVCYVDITAPLYWWKEFDTYRNGVEKNSCSTMHCIHKHEFTLADFSCEHTDKTACCYIYPDATQVEYSDVIYPVDLLRMTIRMLNDAREKFIKTKEKEYWWQMIQLLPSSYNQKRTCMISYEALANMYHARKEHKLDEWREGFCGWVKSLPYAELITGEE